MVTNYIQREKNLLWKLASRQYKLVTSLLCPGASFKGLLAVSRYINWCSLFLWRDIQSVVQIKCYL